MKLILKLTLFLSVVACSSDNNPATNPVTGAINSAKQGLQSLAPSSPSALAFLNSDIGIFADPFNDILVGLKWPGGACEGRSNNVSPRQYLAAVVDADFECLNDGEASVATVFGRFEEDVFALGVISNNLTFQNQRIVAGTYNFTVNVPSLGDVSLSVVATDLTDSEFDTRLDIAPLNATMLFRSRDNIINIFNLEDARTEDEGTGLRWGHLYYNTSNGYISYEWFSLQPGGATLELQRALRPADDDKAYFLHIYSDGTDLKRAAFYGPQGRNSTNFSASMVLQYNSDGATSTYNYHGACVAADTFAATDNFCAGHTDAINITSIDISHIAWGSADSLYTNYAAPSGDVKNRVRGFTNRTQFMSVYP